MTHIEGIPDKMPAAFCLGGGGDILSGGGHFVLGCINGGGGHLVRGAFCPGGGCIFSVHHIEANVYLILSKYYLRRCC